MHRLLAFVLLAACSSDNGETRCKPEGDSQDIGLPVGIRNPDNGECTADGSSCGDDASDDAPPDGPSQYWAPCDTFCNDKPEAECLALDGCRAIYTEGMSSAGYTACWATNTNGPIRGVGCDTDDANECARRDDCIGVHDSSGMFLSCDVEPKSSLGECTFARCTPAE